MLKAFKAYRIKDPNVKEPVPVVTRKPEPNEISQKRPGYDQLTHTGQVGKIEIKSLKSKFIIRLGMRPTTAEPDSK